MRPRLLLFLLALLVVLLASSKDASAAPGRGANYNQGHVQFRNRFVYRDRFIGVPFVVGVPLSYQEQADSRYSSSYHSCGSPPPPTLAPPAAKEKAQTHDNGEVLSAIRELNSNLNGFKASVEARLKKLEESSPPKMPKVESESKEEGRATPRLAPLTSVQERAVLARANPQSARPMPPHPRPRLTAQEFADVLSRDEGRRLRVFAARCAACHARSTAALGKGLVLLD